MQRFCMKKIARLKNRGTIHRQFKVYNRLKAVYGYKSLEYSAMWIDILIMKVLNWYKKEQGITMGEVCKRVGVNQANISPIKSGRQSFTIEQALTLIKLIKNLNGNYLLGSEDSMFKTGAELSPLQALKQAVKLVEQKLK